jgi:TM2 domain-containing membrane protein YozV
MNAQDIITKMDGEEISAKIFEISIDNVQYKRFNNESGPTYTLSKSEIYSIKYENGDKDSWRTLPAKRLSIRLTPTDASPKSKTEREVAKKTPERPKTQTAPKTVIDENNPTIAIAIITKMDGEEIPAKIFEVEDTEVKYKRISNESGPILTLFKSEIYMINYGSGKVMIFNDKPEAIFSLEQSNSEELDAEKSYRHKSPAAAFWLSFLYPGIGQFYNGQAGKGIVMSVLSTASLVGIFTTYTSAIDSYDKSGNFKNANGELFIISSAAMFGTWLWSIIDAPVSAKAINRRNAALSWNMENGNRLSLHPDIVYTSPLKGVNNYHAPAYGVSLKLDF